MSQKIVRRYLRLFIESPRMRRDFFLFGVKKSLQLEAERAETAADLHLLGWPQDRAERFVGHYSDSLRRRDRTPQRIHALAHMAAEGRFDPPNFFSREDYPA